ncbi:contractile injection system tape measure protein [Haliscomenobacter sp.]|uniref:contractile injection system tape measure protein n=1 Tax=Haliscomenobacter sp. TaxID=2717303 RepID=UPI00359319B5
MADHHIQRLQVHVALPAHKGAWERQVQLSTLVQRRDFRQALEAVLDQFAPTEQIWRIDHLELQVDFSSEKSFQFNFIQSLQLALRELRLKQTHQLETSAEMLAAAQNLDAILCYYLHWGILPWYAQASSAVAIRERVKTLLQQTDTVFFQFLWKESKAEARFWRRMFVCLGTPNTLTFLQKQLDPSSSKALKPGPLLTQLEATFHHLHALQQLEFGVSVLLQLVASEPTLPPEINFQQLVDALARVQSDAPLPQPSTSESAISQEWPAEGIWIQNAGLVLLAPFLATLFRNLNWVTGKNFVDTQMQQQAIALLQFMATGESETSEEDLLLNKILCNWPLEEALLLLEPLPTEARQEAENLLLAVIAQWTALKKTSIENLRHTFLQREGKLIQGPDGGWQLYIERKTLDVLLDRLPPGWGYSMVKLPWMQQILYVEW